MKPPERITGAQRRMLFGCARSLGLDKEALGAVVEKLTGKASIKELSKTEARVVIDQLVSAGGRVGKKRKYQRREKAGDSKVVSLPTANQKQYIKDLEVRLEWHREPGHLDNFIKRTLKKEKILSKEEASAVITGLKRVLEHRRKKGLHEAASAEVIHD